MDVLIILLYINTRAHTYTHKYKYMHTYKYNSFADKFKEQHWQLPTILQLKWRVKRLNSDYTNARHLIC